MNLIKGNLSIAVVGSPSSGKSYLLYDLIHAFHVLGYMPQVLPLNYPYSSFGTFFYDIFNANTGGMRGTVDYACRPDNHYGALLDRRSKRALRVNFLNIPGEAFRDLDAVESFFVLKDRIEIIPKGTFWMATYCTPSDHELKLILPQDFDFNDYLEEKLDSKSKFLNYMKWEHIKSMLTDGDYHEKGKRKAVSGKKLLLHLDQYLTDSVLLTLKEVWNQLTGLHESKEYYEENVLNHFYPLTYCQNATDLIICDNIEAKDNAAALIEKVGYYLDKLTGHSPNVYLAFRSADMLLEGKIDHYKKKAMVDEGVSMRNGIYSDFVAELMLSIPEEGDDYQLAPRIEHIRDVAGVIGNTSFRKLLKQSLIKNRKSADIARDNSKPLLPHVFFTATPVDSNFDVYQNDPSDVTRFFLDDGKTITSFVEEVSHDMSRHFCFGSLQLLIDILMHNNQLPSSIKKHHTEILNYFYSNN